MSKTITLNFYCDPGHGWIKIPVKKLIYLGIADKISHYSYMRNGMAYLEEDCDYSTLLKALNDKGITLVLREYHTNKSSKIRSYDRYRYDVIHTNDFIQWLKHTNRLEFITIGG